MTKKDILGLKKIDAVRIISKKFPKLSLTEWVDIYDRLMSGETIK